MTSNHDLTHGIPMLTLALVKAVWPATDAESVKFLQDHGFVLSDGAPDENGPTRSGEMATPFSGVTGHWTITSGALESISIFAYETVPTDRDQLREAFALLDAGFTWLFGTSSVNVAPGEAPQSLWQTAGHAVSLDCRWSGDRIGVIQLSIEPQ